VLSAAFLVVGVVPRKLEKNIALTFVCAIAAAARASANAPCMAIRAGGALLRAALLAQASRLPESFE
jgi:hypothetical protein